MDRCRSGDLVDLWLGMLEVGEGHAGEDFVNAPLEHAPDRTNAAGGRRIAAFFVHAVDVAVDLERHVLRGFVDATESVRRSRAGGVPARTARGRRRDPAPIASPDEWKRLSRIPPRL